MSHTLDGFQQSLIVLIDSWEFIRRTMVTLSKIGSFGSFTIDLIHVSSHWALIGSAIKVRTWLYGPRSWLMYLNKISQNLGLSRLGNETGSRQYPPEWRSAIRREVARRVWWSLVGFIFFQSSWFWRDPRWLKTGLMQWRIRALILFIQSKIILHFLQILMTPIW